MIRFPLTSNRSSIKIAPANRFSNTGDVARERTVVCEWWRELPHSSKCTLDTATSFQWMAMFQTFSSGKELDGEQIFRKIDDRPQLQRARHSHGYVIFFSAGRCDVVNAGRMREHARFVDQRGRRDMRNHETRFQAGPVSEKCR